MNFRPPSLFSLLAAATVGSSCAVFPDEAVLPTHQGDEIGVGGDDPGHAGAPGLDAGAGAGGDDATTTGSAPFHAPSGGAGSSSGAGGEQACRSSRTVPVIVESDAWIDAAEPNARHGDDATLFVMAGAAERRALFAATLPDSARPARLVRATFVLHLQSNADPNLAMRELELHRLDTAFSEARTSWLRYDNGDKWQQAGGDFEPTAWSAVLLPAGTERGVVSFELTDALGESTPSSPVTLAWLVLETPRDASRGELSFASADQDIDERPMLLLEYCDD